MKLRLQKTEECSAFVDFEGVESELQRESDFILDHRREISFALQSNKPTEVVMSVLVMHGRVISEEQLITLKLKLPLII